MDRAFAVAGSVGVAPHEILLSLGWVDEGLYVGDLAQALGIMRLPEAAASAHDRLIGFGAALVERDGGALLVVDAVRRSPADVAHLIDQSGWPADRTALATASEFDGLAAAVMGAVWMDEATWWMK